jgi:hypothetical protein
MNKGSSASDTDKEYTVARGRRNETVTAEENTVVEEVPVEETQTFDEVDVPAVDDEAEVVATTEGDAKEKTEKAPAKPKRGDLDDGFITPVQFAKELSQPKDGNAENDDEDNWHYTGKSGSHVVAPQMVYSYIRSNGEGSKHPIVTQSVTDSNGQTRDNVLNRDEAFAWWTAKNERAKERAANAKAKAEKVAAKPESTSTTEADVTTSGEPVVEAE